MYKIERKPWGFMLTFGGSVGADEMSKWLEESKTALTTAPSKFGVYADLRELQPLTPEAQAFMQEGQKAYKAGGMERSAVALNSSLTAMQFKRIGKETGIYQWERYIDASSVSNWEAVGVAWIKDGKDPDA